MNVIRKIWYFSMKNIIKYFFAVLGIARSVCVALFQKFTVQDLRLLIARKEILHILLPLGLTFLNRKIWFVGAWILGV